MLTAAQNVVSPGQFGASSGSAIEIERRRGMQAAARLTLITSKQWKRWELTLAAPRRSPRTKQKKKSGKAGRTPEELLAELADLRRAVAGPSPATGPRRRPLPATAAAEPERHQPPAPRATGTGQGGSTPTAWQLRPEAAANRATRMIANQASSRRGQGQNNGRSKPGKAAKRSEGASAVQREWPRQQGESAGLERSADQRAAQGGQQGGANGGGNASGGCPTAATRTTGAACTIGPNGGGQVRPMAGAAATGIRTAAASTAGDPPASLDGAPARRP